MSWLVDAHVHYQDCFGWDRFLTAAFDNLDAVNSASSDTPASAGCLAFVDVEQSSTFGRLQALDLVRDLPELRRRHGECALEATEDAAALVLRRAQGAPLFLLAGRQMATREGLEVLALGTLTRLEERLSLEDSIRAALEAEALTVVPWGFGKWSFARGRMVESLLDGALASSIHLGDNGNRAQLGGEPELFARARARGMRLLSGSDPLPLSHHARRALSYGFRLTGELDPSRPVRSLRRVAEPSAEISNFGRLCPLPRFVVDQLRMQIHARRRRRSDGAA